jgi:hypothetical protein
MAQKAQRGAKHGNSRNQIPWYAYGRGDFTRIGLRKSVT